MAAAKTTPVYIGIKGSVLALDRATGEILWQTKLKGSDFVNVVLDGRDILATTRGVIFCLDAATGQIRWHNPLQGYGFGVVTIATTDGNVAPAVQKMRNDAEERLSSSET